ncbi:helix-turn-helix domain-containing protein [Kitasatospora sp. NPDC059646]|uniref:helix-turn-helix domain-containing protein n=1 Tax=Kitasatospora sp. NPDC059646 TaxID=3346893 RepID=UPI003676F9FB
MVDQMKEREVTDVATLKALADPLRLAVLGSLMKRDPEPVSVKEIAADLDEAPTKLYRHVKQLEQAGLVFVAETRLVSGIVESRYRSAQQSLRLSPQVYAEGEQPPAALGAMLAAMDLVRADFRRNFLAGRIDLTPASQGNLRPSKFAHTTTRLTPERLRRLRARLDEVLDELFAEEESTGPDTVEVTLFALLYAVQPAPQQPTGD